MQHETWEEQWGSLSSFSLEMLLLLLLLTDIKTQQCVSQQDIHFFAQFSFPQRSASRIHLYYFRFNTLLLLKSLSLHVMAITKSRSRIRKYYQATLSSWPPHNQSGQQRSGSRTQMHTPRTWFSTGLKWALDAYGCFWQRTFSTGQCKSCKMLI